MSNDEPTCEGSAGPLNDKTCEVCGDRYSSDEPPQHPNLCPYHAARIDRETDEKLENDHFNWFGE